jgi:hypothetical protein
MAERGRIILKPNTVPGVYYVPIGLEGLSDLKNTSSRGNGIDKSPIMAV